MSNESRENWETVKIGLIIMIIITALFAMLGLGKKIIAITIGVLILSTTILFVISKILKKLSSSTSIFYFLFVLCSFFTVLAFELPQSSEQPEPNIEFAQIMLWITGFIFIIWILATLLSFVKLKRSKEKSSSDAQRTQLDAISQMAHMDQMDGHTFEYWCANLLRSLGYHNVTVTRGSGDQGVDIVATLDGERWAFQCKRYSSNLGNKPVQEVYTGMAMYNCSVGVVMTNQSFTNGAIDLARRTGIHLWGRATLVKLLELANGKPEKAQPLDEEYYKNLPHIPYVEG